jgi:diguanylate cyclase (GGDEF)-like protein
VRLTADLLVEMAVPHPQAGLREDKPRALTPSPAPEEQPGEDVRRLGEALEARTEDVVNGTVGRATDAGGVLVDALVQSSFDRICRVSTVALAKWMAGGSPEDGREASQEAFQHHGQMAAQRAAPLNEMTKRCLRWRDAVDEVLCDSATHLGISPKALSRALAMVQLTLDVTLVRMSEVFETERQRTDEELARRQEELAFMATHDALTGLPNRTLILDRTEQMLVRGRRHQTPVAALFIDLDNFKSVNDTLSHGAGDELLRAVAERLDGVVRDTDALGRLGGDEFVVIAEELSLATGPELIAERLLEALGEPFELPGEQKTRVTVTTSIGIAIGERASAEELLRDADIAMYQAKWDGKNRYVVFESGMQHAVQSRMELEMDLRDALPNDEFFLVYQPTFDLRDMSPIGVEALIRWKHPTRGIVQPNDFIPLLEETGLIIEVGKWVLEEACRQGAKWREAGYSIGMAVNVSGRQLDTDEFVTNVRDALSDSELDAEALTLEVTETTLMRNVEETARRLTAIKKLGVRIAIDDFGTGYSSLAHLQQFPVDALKIDRSFISRLTQNPEGATLMHTLVQLGKALSIETLAEGIEQQQELSLLQAEHCDSGQGFLFARPLDVDATEAFLENWAKHGTPANNGAPASARRTHRGASTPTTTRH